MTRRGRSPHRSTVGRVGQVHLGSLQPEVEGRQVRRPPSLAWSHSLTGASHVTVNSRWAAETPRNDRARQWHVWRNSALHSHPEDGGVAVRHVTQVIIGMPILTKYT